jgi:aspartyl-tRNA(Asn)/glutamyl-tRNA(Gln) amidotransferase subunit A
MDDPPGNKAWKPFSGWVNLAKLPAASVPCGTTRAGLPVGLQVVGPRFAEAKVLRMARAVERAVGFERPDFLPLTQEFSRR